MLKEVIKEIEVTDTTPVPKILSSTSFSGNDGTIYTVPDGKIATIELINIGASASTAARLRTYSPNGRANYGNWFYLSSGSSWTNGDTARGAGSTGNYTWYSDNQAYSNDGSTVYGFKSKIELSEGWYITAGYAEHITLRIVETDIEAY